MTGEPIVQLQETSTQQLSYQVKALNTAHQVAGSLHDQPEWLLWALSIAFCNMQDAAPNANILRLRVNIFSAPSPPCPIRTYRRAHHYSANGALCAPYWPISPTSVGILICTALTMKATPNKGCSHFGEMQDKRSHKCLQLSPLALHDWDPSRRFHSHDEEYISPCAERLIKGTTRLRRIRPVVLIRHQRWHDLEGSAYEGLSRCSRRNLRPTVGCRAAPQACGSLSALSAWFSRGRMSARKACRNRPVAS
ncbi:hypothetical protein TgHK011_003127 [Trichoderma gracile]|nr:hypothetical protein TgHK011_003127 [Trichoderma gracile]